ncbi:hypothetical protein PLIIFM63780_005908 [Purpureocillium lilacinum]|nr:hypothetical protein PLIIFM63780_005908 [Purpureocillium lilacinum]
MSEKPYPSERHRSIAESWIEERDMAAQSQEVPRQSFQEALAITPLPASQDGHGRLVKRYMSQQPAWKPGDDLPWEALFSSLDGPRPKHGGPGVFGGHVYAQAPLCAARAVEEEEEQQLVTSSKPQGKLGIHSIQGVFTAPGLKDRPFVYEVAPLSNGRSFSARIVNARQTKEPSTEPLGPFPASDAELPLKDVCFSCITTFKRSHPIVDDIRPTQSAQEIYADILSTRAPHEWDLSPQTDVDIIKDLFPNAGHGAFPILDMHKVDMTEFNAGKPIPERRELIYYRLMKPLDEDDVNAHIVCHAYEADRNGLIMCGNHLGYGYNLGVAASLTYSFFVHVNPEEMVLDTERWWLQEVSWPRVNAGRCMMESKLWSPEGKHVASGYQDGIIQPDKFSGGYGKL